MKNLSIGGIFQNSIQLGINQAAPLFLTILLWILTIWIPYVNVGTTIGMIGAIIALGRGEQLNPTGIFDAKYRSNIGEFFLLVGFMLVGQTVGYLFLVIPGMVLQIAWILAPYLLVDKNMTPLDAIKRSNELTNGYKWTIFFGIFLFIFAATILYIIATGITSWIFVQMGLLYSTPGLIISLTIQVVLYAIWMSMTFSMFGYIYAVLSGNSKE